MDKKLAVLAGECRLRSSAERVNAQSCSNDRVPLPAIRLLEPGAEYKIDGRTIYEDERLSPTSTLDLESSQEVAQHYGSRYVEAVIIFGDMWFLITSFDAFLHHMSTLDDCADKSSMAPNLQSTAPLQLFLQICCWMTLRLLPSHQTTALEAAWI